MACHPPLIVTCSARPGRMASKQLQQDARPLQDRGLSGRPPTTSSIHDALCGWKFELARRDTSPRPASAGWSRSAMGDLDGLADLPAATHQCGGPRSCRDHPDSDGTLAPAPCRRRRTPGRPVIIDGQRRLHTIIVELAGAIFDRRPIGLLANAMVVEQAAASVAGRGQGIQYVELHQAATCRLGRSRRVMVPNIHRSEHLPARPLDLLLVGQRVRLRCDGRRRWRLLGAQRRATRAASTIHRRRRRWRPTSFAEATPRRTTPRPQRPASAEGCRPV